MSDTIEPALTADEWAERAYLSTGLRVQRVLNGPFGQRRLRVDVIVNPIETVEDLAALAALVNEALPSDHPLKITRELANDVRSVAFEAETFHECTQDPTDLK